MKFADIKIGIRLGLGFATVLMLMVSMVLLGYIQLVRVGDVARKMTEEELIKERLTAELASNVRQTGIRALAAVTSTDPAMVEFFKDRIRETETEDDEIINKLKARLSQAEGRARLADAQEKIQSLVAIREDLLSQRAKGMDQETINRLVSSEFLPARQACFDSIAAFAEFGRGVINVAGEDIQSNKRFGIYMLLALGGLAIALGMFMAWRLARGITQPLAQALTLAKSVAAGDLTSNINVTGHDEIAELLQALKTMNDNLAQIVTEVRSGVETIATASGEIASGNLDLSARTEQQASSLEQTASAMEQLTSTVKQNTQSANQANQQAGSASDVAIKGGQVVDQVIASMGAINNASKRISEIIGVIDGIAFQTNILALNAAVEAARAGEQGRGFAVVATEVRSLALRSANAAKEIKGLITDSVESVAAGSQQVEQAGLTIKEVVDSVNRVSSIVRDISVASDEQATGIEQINQAIMQMDDVTQQNAALVEQAAAASQSLQHQAENLARAVSVFKINGQLATSISRALPVQSAAKFQYVRAASGISPVPVKPLITSPAVPRPQQVTRQHQDQEAATLQTQAGHATASGKPLANGAGDVDEWTEF